MANILIVDDHPANRTFLADLLEYKGHRLLEAADGAQALDVVRAEHPDLVICDVLMPTMDGFELVRQLRADPEIAQTKVIFYTAHYNEREAKNLAQAAGVSHVLTKPCEPELVLRVVDEALGRPLRTAPPIQPEIFDTEHLRLVTDKLSAAVEDLQIANRRLSALIELNLRLASERDPLRLMDDVCRGARELLGARYSVLGIRGKESGDTAHFATSGFSAEVVATFGLPPLDRGILGQIQAQRIPHRLKNPARDFVSIGLPHSYPPVHSLLAAPVVSLAHVYGWICLTDKLGAQEFSVEDEHLLTILAAQVGRIYENGSLYAKIQRHATELQQEIEERKRVEEEVRETRNFLASIFDNIPSSIFVKDARDLRFVRANTACENQTGYLRAEMVGKTDYDLFPREQADTFVAKDRETLASGQRVITTEENITAKDGSQRLLQTKKISIPDKYGQPRYLLGMSEDITERSRAEKALLESEAKYRQLIEQASDGIFISDKEGNFLLVNSRGSELLGYAPAEMIGMNGRVTYLDEEVETHSRRMKEAASGETLRFERTIRRKDGTTFPAEISVKMLDNAMVQVIFHDITARRNQEQKIARLSRIQAVLSGINSAIVRIHDQQALFDEACRIATDHGAFPIAIIGTTGPDSPLEQVSWGGAGAALLSELPSSARGGPAGVAMRAINEQSVVIDNDIAANPSIDPIRKAAVARGCRSAIGLPLFREKAIAGVFLLYGSEKNFFDEEEVKLLSELAGDVSFALTFIAQQEKVDYLAYYDPLTELPNRTLFFDRLGNQLGTARRDSAGMALVLIDLDRFRLVNDSLGRQAGDELLKAVAKRIKGSLRGQDSVARIGSNRFAFAVSGISNVADAAHAMEARNNALFGKPFILGHEELRVLATAGVAMFPMDGNDAETLFANAEAALRKAKTENLRYLFFSPEITARVADSLRLESKLRGAIDNDELILWYQPKVDTETRKLAGFEALMRWGDPETGMVPPAKFIPLMEQTGLILDAGRWALLQVGRDCRTWAMGGLKPPRIAVNVSPLQLRQKDFLSTVIEAAAQAEDAGALLELEITESVIMENVESIIPLLQTVRGLGVQIAVDDFGTGYSSLAYIARLPIQALKIDRSFVVGMTQSEDNLTIVRSVISLAHGLRLRVIAEGVETEEQAALLLEFGCDQMQGYLFSRPVPPQDVPDLLRRPSLRTQVNPAGKAPASAKNRPQ